MKRETWRWVVGTLDKRGLAALLVVVLLASCGGGDDNNSESSSASLTSTTNGSDSASTASPTTTTEKPDDKPSIEVAFFSVDPAASYFRFVALITNPTDHAIGDLETEWTAYDADGAIVGNRKGKRPVIPAGSTFAYVGGAGAANLSGTPARVDVKIVDNGREVDDVPLFAAEGVTLEPVEFSDELDYTVNATITTGSDPVQRTSIGISVVLKDAGGAIVGADFTSAENVPDELPAGTKFKVEAYGIMVTAEPASAEVTSYVEPAS